MEPTAIRKNRHCKKDKLTETSEGLKDVERPRSETFRLLLE